MTETLEQQVNKLKSKIFKYESTLYKLEKWRIKDGKYILETNKRTFVLYKNELEDLLNKITLINDSESFMPNVLQEKGNQPSGKLNLQLYEPTETQKKVQDSLVAMLEKVQTDPATIPQAKAVCDIANTLVNMEKNQISLMNALKRKR